MAGDQVPSIPLGEGVDNNGAVEPEQKGGIFAKLAVALTLTSTCFDKRQLLEVAVVNDISSIAKSLPGNAIFVLIICIFAVVAKAEFQVPDILVQPVLPALDAERGAIIICTPFIKTLN